MSSPVLTYDLVTEPRGGFLFARLRTVALTPDVIGPLLQELRAAMLDARLSRLLVEYEVAFALTEHEALEFTNKIMDVLSGMRIAFVAANSKHAPSLRFGTAVAGFAREDHRFFTDVALAEEWLHDESA